MKNGTLVTGLMLGFVWGCQGGSADGDGSGELDAGGDVAGDVIDDAEGDGSGIAEIRRIEYEFADNVRYFDEAAATAAVSDYDEQSGQLVLSAGAPGVDAVAAGTVLVAGMSPQTPHGLLRRVMQVETVGETVVVTTEPAALAHAFRQLDVEVAGQLPSGTIVVGGDSQKASDSDAYTEHFGGEIDWVVFDGDDDYSTTDDQVRISGLIDAWAGYAFGFSYDLGVLDFLDFSDYPPDLDPTEVDLRFDFGVDLGAIVDITAEGAASLSYEKEIEFGRTYLPAFGVGPLIFVPVLKATGRIFGGVPGEFTVHTGFESGFAAGVSFSVSDGFESNFTAPYFEGTSPSADVEITATARAEVDLEIDLLLYGVIGPKAGLAPWAQLDADVDAAPCWTARVGVDAFVGVVIELFSVELADEDWRFPIDEVVVGSGSCPAGQAFDPPPVWSSAWVGGNAYSQSSDMAVTQLARAVDGTMLLAGQTSRALFKVDHEGDTIWARGYRRVGAVLERLLAVQAFTTRNDGGLWIGTDDNTVIFASAGGTPQRATRLDIDSDQPVQFAAAVVADDGTVLAVTPWHDVGSSLADAALLRFHPDGSVDGWRWGDETWDDSPRAIVPWGSGFAMIVHAQSFSETPGSVTHVLVLDQAGNVTANHTLSDCEDVDEVVLRAAVEIDDGHLVLGGYERFSGPRALLVNVAPDGTVGWASANAAPSILGFDISSIQRLDSGAYIVGGTRVRAAPNDVFVARADAIGRFAWLSTLGGESNEEAPAVLTHPDGSVIFAAASDSFEEGNGAWWLSRLDSRDGALALAPGGLVTAQTETFTATDTCIASVVGPTATTPLSIDAPTAEVTVEAVEFESVELVP